MDWWFSGCLQTCVHLYPNSVACVFAVVFLFNSDLHGTWCEENVTMKNWQTFLSSNKLLSSAVELWYYAFCPPQHQKYCGLQIFFSAGVIGLLAWQLNISLATSLFYWYSTAYCNTTCRSQHTVRDISSVSMAQTKARSFSHFVQCTNDPLVLSGSSMSQIYFSWFCGPLSFLLWTFYLSWISVSLLC